MDKQILIGILDKCKNNKSLNDFNLILTTINYLKCDETVYKGVEDRDDVIYVVCTNNLWTLQVSFCKDNRLGITLPYSGLFIIPNDSYDIQYDEIKSILIGTKGV